MGSDRLVVQAGGGNASIKERGRLHIKASGFWLQDCLDREMFVELDLDAARTVAAGGGEDFVSARTGANNLKPSIETGFHALMPHRVVLHAHPVNAIAATLTPSGRVRLAEAMAGGRGALVDYFKPGARLAMQVNRIIAEQQPNVIVLANHGVILGADTAEAAAGLLTDLECDLQVTRAIGLAQPPGASTLPGYTRIAAGPAAELATLPDRVVSLAAGSIAPDQTVYLGGAPIAAQIIVEAQALINLRLGTHGIAPGLVFVAGAAYVRDDLPPSGWAMIDMVCEVGLRTTKGEQAATLSLADETELLNWDAEKHRQSIDRAR
jgi:ribulose-5-phosphate 4-epimerase/fuculose-1-phosphate aldolase